MTEKTAKTTGFAADEKKKLGARGEDAAVAFLRGKGVTIRARNYRVKEGEIDIVGEYGGVILFVEVKTRSGKAYGRAGAAVDYRKQRKIIAAAERYLQRENLPNCPCRFDVLEVYSDGESFRIVPIAGAFEA